MISLSAKGLSKSDIKKLAAFKGKYNSAPFRVGSVTYEPGHLQFFGFAGKLDLPPQLRGGERDISGGSYCGSLRFEQVSAEHELGSGETTDFNKLVKKPSSSSTTG